MKSPGSNWVAASPGPKRWVWAIGVRSSLPVSPRWLIEVVDSARTPIQGDLAELVEDRSGGRIHRAKPELQAKRLRGPCVGRRDSGAQLGQIDQINLCHFPARGLQVPSLGIAPHHHRRDRETRPCLEVVQRPDDRARGCGQAELLAQLAE